MRHIAVAVSIAIPMAALVAASDKYPGVNPAGGDIEITPIIPTETLSTQPAGASKPARG